MIKGLPKSEQRQARGDSGSRLSMAGALVVTSLWACFTFGCQDDERTLVGGEGSGGAVGGGAGFGGTPDGSGGANGGASGGAAGTTDPGSGGNGGGAGDASAPEGAGGAVADAAVDEVVISGADAAIDVQTTPPAAGARPDAPIVTPPPPPLQECNALPSLDRLQYWMIGSDDGVVTAPQQGSILVREGDRYVGKVGFIGNGWHLVAVWIANVFASNVDLTNAGGFTLSYSSTAPFWVQMRPASRYSGGNHFLAALPATGGQIQSKYIAFTPGQWTTLARLGTPALPFTDAVKEVRALTFVGDVPNQIVFHGLRFDTYVPPCR